mgnify:CR=1 FL=1
MFFAWDVRPWSGPLALAVSFIDSSQKFFIRR